MKRFAAMVLLLLSAQPVLAEDEDPIDAQLTACLDKPEGSSTQGMVECFDAAYTAWDKALNDAYDEVIGSVDAESAALLRKSQRDWLAYRDAEQAFWAGGWTADRGSIMRVILGEANVDMVKARVLMLRSYLSN